ncbi:MAG: Lrp/AsnC family transcriptional regulator [Methanophagales archaeon]|nr:Lrp/AsnC family transcriptional regulator [Methanophagales archaeon]
MRLREKDKCILRLLIQNGRLPFAEIGRRCDVSRQVAFERVRRFLEEGLVEGFTIRLNEEKFGLSFRAYVLIIAKPSESLRKELINFLQKSRNVRRIQLLFGRYDFFLELLFRNKDEMTDFIREMHAFEAVERTETFIVYQTLKEKPEDPFLALLDADAHTDTNADTHADTNADTNTDAHADAQADAKDTNRQESGKGEEQ